MSTMLDIELVPWPFSKLQGRAKRKFCTMGTCTNHLRYWVVFKIHLELNFQGCYKKEKKRKKKADQPTKNKNMDPKNMEN